MTVPAALRLVGATRVLAAGSAKRVAVVFPSALEPCAEAVEGLRARLSGSDWSLDLMDVNGPGFEGDNDRELARKPAIVVAVGSDAVRAVLARASPVKTVSTMTLEADGGPAAQAGRMAAAVYLDIPLRALAAELRKIFPDKSRLGVIRNPGRAANSAAHGPPLEPASTQIADCAKAEDLLPVFLAFRKKVDFVVCLPDGSLYNSATVRPLIMASLENRLPIVGFSPAFLRAGAATAIYPNYRGIGEQTADLVRHCLEPGDCASWEPPRKIDTAVNAKICRMLGLDFKTASQPNLVVLR
jgi:hypothetical protein